MHDYMCLALCSTKDLESEPGLFITNKEVRPCDTLFSFQVE